MTMTLNRMVMVLVPKPGTRASRNIDPGSGVVTLAAYWRSAADTDRVLVYYEGNRYGAVNLTTFEERVLQAAGRLDKRYPTIAKGAWPAIEFDVVGTFSFSEDWRAHRLDVTDAALVARWCAAGGHGV